MRTTTVVKRLLGVTQISVKAVLFEDEALVAKVRPRWRKPRCSGCGKRASRYDRAGPRRWRHLPYGRLPVFLETDLCRVACEGCGVRVEAVPWGGPRSGFTFVFEELVAYLCQVTDKTKVTDLMGISWRTVGRIVERVVSTRLDDSRLDGLLYVGVDDFSYRKYHRYLTVVVDHESRRVVWAAKGRGAKALGSFFDALGEARLGQLSLVSVDMAGGYLKALAEKAPHVEVVIDRFHVQRLMSDAVDEVRRAQVRELEGEEAKAVKGTRYVLLKNPWDLSQEEGERLAEVQRNNEPLYRAYLLKETLAAALDYKQPWRAKQALKDWLAWASRSKLAPVVRCARTIRKHFDGIMAYVEHRITNGVVEGINTRLRMIARRAFGFHSAAALVSLLFLCCGGVELDPPLPRRLQVPT